MSAKLTLNTPNKDNRYNHFESSYWAVLFFSNHFNITWLPCKTRFGKLLDNSRAVV